MSPFKIIFVGADGAGKTTAIRAISENWPREAQSGIDNVSEDVKDHVAVSVNNYGFVDQSGAIKLWLYEANRLADFNASLAESTVGNVGINLLINNTQVDFQSSLWFYWDLYTQLLPEVPIAIGITHMDISNKPTIADYHDQLLKTAIKPPVFTVDARNKADVALLVQSAWCASRIV